MSVAPSKATSAKLEAYRSPRVSNLCSNAILLEAAVAFHSGDPFPDDVVATAKDCREILDSLGAEFSEVNGYGYLNGNVHELTVSTLLQSVISEGLSQTRMSTSVHAALGSLASSCPLPADMRARLLWSSEAPVLLAAKESAAAVSSAQKKAALKAPSQGQMDVALALKLESGFRDKVGTPGLLPVAFIELTKGTLDKKAKQMLSNSIGCMQFMTQADCVCPILGIALNSEYLKCVAFCPDIKETICEVVICESDASVDSLCRMLRTMWFWSVGVQPFMSVANSFAMRPARNVVMSSTSSVQRNRCRVLFLLSCFIISCQWPWICVLLLLLFFWKKRDHNFGQ